MQRRDMIFAQTFVLVVILLGFYLKNPAFLSSFTVVSMMQFAAPVGIISLGIVVVLLVGEIDLSVGSVSGLAGATMAVLLVYHSQSMLVSLVCGILVGTAIGLLYAALYNYVGVPSFVISLGGLLAFQGALLVVLGKNGTVNIPNTSGIARFARNEFVTGAAAYLMVVVIAAAYLGAMLYGRSRRTAAGLSAVPLVLPLVKAGLTTPTSSTGRKLRVPVVPTASRARSRSSTPGSWTRMERLPCTEISGSCTDPRFSMRWRMISTALSSTAASVPSGATRVTEKPPLRSSPRVGPQPVTTA